MGSPDEPAARSDLPVAWLGLVMVALFLVLWYPYRDLMGARCEPAVVDGLDPVAGMAVSLAVCVASVLVGGRIFSTMNILPKER